MMLSPRTAAVCICLAAASIVGCAQKPPECGDPKTLETIRTLTVDNAKEILTRVPRPEVYQDDPAQIQNAYFQGMRVEMAHVVSDGYNSQARKNTCRAKLTINSVSGKFFSRDVDYSTQMTQDKDGSFLVEIAAYAPFVDAVVSDFMEHFTAKRYAGEWRGTYTCQGIRGETAGPQGPYSMDVALVVEPTSKATMERTTRGGGIERLTGEVNYTVQLAGEGQNSPDDTWRTVFQGQVKGLALVASGQIATPEGELLRRCELSLKLADR